MKHKINAPTGHVATTGIIATHTCLTLASHWLDHTIEATMFCAGGLLAAFAADMEREWDAHFHPDSHAHK